LRHWKWPRAEPVQQVAESFPLRSTGQVKHASISTASQTAKSSAASDSRCLTAVRCYESRRSHSATKGVCR
jgi:hypothetical protein